MTILLKNVQLVDENHPLHQQKVTMYIANGYIESIGKETVSKSADWVVEMPHLCVSAGWFDSSVAFGEPGLEDAETIANGLQVAAKSGFTDIALQPYASPVIDNASSISFVQQKAAGNATNLHPIGAFTQQSRSDYMAELFEMKKAGAIAFGDFKTNCNNPALVKIGLQYLQNFDGLLMAFSQNKDIAGKGVMNEGIASTKLGLKGIPTLAESIEVARNIALLEYTGGKLHLPTISTAESVAMIKAAKVKGLSITCSVAAHSLALTDDCLAHFSTAYKTLPPIRNEHHRQALVNGVLDGTIDCITSDHWPVNVEHKFVEFDLAHFGSIGLEACFSVLHNILPTEVLVAQLTAARTVFGFEKIKIATGEKACLSLFTTEEAGIFEKENVLSTSQNCAFINLPTKGKVIGIINNQQIIFSSK